MSTRTPSFVERFSCDGAGLHQLGRGRCFLDVLQHSTAHAAQHWPMTTTLGRQEQRGGLSLVNALALCSLHYTSAEDFANGRRVAQAEWGVGRATGGAG